MLQAQFEGNTPSRDLRGLSTDHFNLCFCYLKSKFKNGSFLLIVVI